MATRTAPRRRQKLSRAGDVLGVTAAGREMYERGEAGGVHPPYTPPRYAARTPLSTNQHILHLLLTVFTGGLWLPVWIILAARGNTVARG